MTDLQKLLIENADKEYALFQARIVPTVKNDTFIGVRLPVLRKIAADFAKTPECDAFLFALPHRYYDENLIHSVLLGKIGDFDRCMKCIEAFLPYIDNWAVCDTISPKALAKNKAALIVKIREWIKSKSTYTCRFAVNMLMKYYLKDDFAKEYADMVSGIESDDYYVKTVVAWYFATALATNWDEVIPFVENRVLDDTTHRLTVRKAIESFRITDRQKEYLKTLR